MGPAGGGSGRPGVASQILRESVPQSRVRITQQQSVCGSVICDKCETDLSICNNFLYLYFASDPLPPSPVICSYEPAADDSQSVACM